MKRDQPDRVRLGSATSVRSTVFREAVRVAIVCTLALAGTASAQEDYEAARERFDRAQAQYDAGNFALAADGFREAYDMMEGHPRRHMVLFNLARCLDRSAAMRQARDAYQQYLAEGGAGEPDGATARERIEELDRRIALSATSDAQDEHTERAAAPTGDDTLVIAGGAVLGAGAAGFIAMGIFGGLALAEDARLRDGCGATRSCSEAEVADADTFALASDISLGLAGAAAIAGGILLAVGLTSGGADERAAVVPWIAPSGAGVVAHVPF